MKWVLCTVLIRYTDIRDLLTIKLVLGTFGYIIDLLNFQFSLSYRELSQKNRFLQRTERGFQCANSQNLFFFKWHVITSVDLECTLSKTINRNVITHYTITHYVMLIKRGNHRLVFFLENW